MRLVKASAFVLLWIFFFAAAALLHVAVSLFRLPGRWRIISRLTRGFARLLTLLLRIRVSVEGKAVPTHGVGACIAANHLGYVDGIVLGSLFPVIFVSKKEVRGWPVIGQWTALCGTVFVDRRRKDKIPLLVEEIAAKLREGLNVLIFPEGTSTDGEKMLAFQSAPFAAPLRTRSPIVPVTLTYTAINDEPVSRANRDRVYWYGDMEFFGHFWNLLGLKSIEVLVKLHPPIDTALLKNNSFGRKQLSRVCYDRISGQPGLNRSGAIDSEPRAVHLLPK